jgi:TetR/AcrR family fatty acid metabolism transcriptional regulator
LTPADGEGPLTSRTRLLNAGKTLFARNGYEQTSTAAIAREAGSSESQLIRYFGGKAGLLEAIFNDSWVPLNAQADAHIAEAEHGRDGVVRLLTMTIRALANDPETAFLFLFEGRRLRGSTQEILLSDGYVQFMTRFEQLIERGRTDGSFRSDIEPQILCSAIFGASEGMLRSKIQAKRRGEPDIYDEDAILRTFTAMVNGLAP